MDPLGGGRALCLLKHSRSWTQENRNWATLDTCVIVSATEGCERARRAYTKPTSHGVSAN